MRLACCGDDCDSCLRYLATKSANMERLERVALMWKKVEK